MALSVNLSKVKGDFSNLKNNAFKSTPPGRGMVKITEWKEYGFTKGKNPAHILVLQIVAWTNPDGIGVEHEEIIFTDDGTREEDQCAAKLLKLSFAAGLLTPAEAEAARSAGQDLDLDFTTGLPGRCFMTEIVHRKGKDDKEYCNIGEGGFAIYHCKDPKTKDWPKHNATLNQIGHLIGEWQPLNTEATPPVPAKTAPSNNPFAAKV